ncbi:NUDIX hydrolase [Microbacterium neungamense]|uniref:NUDIX hydrolase n=1 Tax=Microbacterium neungamense TaxID=2810535 RepID=UPI00217D500C|nr:NUDIX domain-containing protein [Microbacterium neungamense]UWF78241.1 NUDIX domain-containing protein [Microbacterium neungamense]
MDASLPVAGTAVVLRDGPAGPEALLLRRPASGSFADAWVFPGGKVEPVDALPGGTEADAALRAAVRETAEETGIRIADPALLSQWSPPPEVPVRIRTWFFLARDLGDPLRLSPDEVVEAAWMTVAEAFRRHEAGEMSLFPPTWVTLHGLRDRATVDDVYAALGAPEHFVTRMRRTAEGMLALWGGDEEHPEAPGEAGQRHRLLMAAPPWRYERRP